MTTEIQTYNAALTEPDQKICETLQGIIDQNLPEAESKLWHGHPVWFLEGNPVVGYSKQKNWVQLLFWSGQSFDEDGLQDEGSFKASQAHFTAADQINQKDLERWLKKSREIQWDYKNIVKRRGVLERLK